MAISSGTEVLNKVIVNKISKNKYDILVNNGTISEEMIKEQVWIFTDDQFVSSDNIINWNNKADYNNVYSKSEINNMFSTVNSDINDINSTIGDIATVLSTLTIPTKFEEELRQI